MTLNILLAARWGAYLTGDFRLTYGDGYQDDLDAQKLVPVFKFGWGALVSFCGVAKTADGIDVGDWITESTAAIGRDEPFDALGSALLGANSWLGSVRGDRRLTFSVVGFVGRRPVVMVVSNCEGAGGESSRVVQPRLVATEHRPKKPTLLVFGDARAVPEGDRRSLVAALAAAQSPLSVHAKLASVSSAASERSKVISPECVTGHLLPTGKAEVTPHGIPDGVEYVPRFAWEHMVANGVTGFRLRKDDEGNALPPKWVGMTATVQRGAVVMLHAWRNVEKPTGGPAPNGDRVFWKVAGPDEPDSYTFTLGGPDRP